MSMENHCFSRRGRIKIAACRTEGKQYAKILDSGYQYEMANIRIDPHATCFYSEMNRSRGISDISQGGACRECRHNSGRQQWKTAKYYLDRWIDSMPEIKKGSIIEENSGGIPIGAFMESMTLDNFLRLATQPTRWTRFMEEALQNHLTRQRLQQTW